jgi:hypothetical protein
MPPPTRILLLLLLACLAACAPAVTPAGETPSPTGTATPSPLPASTATPTASGTPTSAYTATQSATPTVDTRPLPREWSSWPIVPTPSARVLEIYRQGQLLGVTPASFSVVGDCQSEPNVFLGLYGTDGYRLAARDAYLQETIDAFAAWFQHDSLAVRDGFSAPTVLDPLWADAASCAPTESPLSCELRLARPMIVFINLGTNWRADASVEVYKGYLRRILDEIIAAGAIPILSNKADNIEGNHGINRVTAELAYEYDIPLINFWLATDSLDHHALDMDRDPPGVYLTPLGWDIRSFLALRTLDAVWRFVSAAVE